MMLRFVSTAAIRAIASPKIRFVTPIATAALREGPTLSDHRHFSSSNSGDLVGRKVIGAIKSQIKAHEQALLKSRGGVPKNLPFAIEDDDKYCHIMLTRVYGDEKIEVTVNPIHDPPEKTSPIDSYSDSSDSDTSSTDSESESEVDSDSSEAEEPPPPLPQSVRINVSIIKEKKGTLDIGANVGKAGDELFVDRISFTEPNNYVPSLTYYVEQCTDLEYAFRVFVEERGIAKSSVGFLYDYMVEKRKRWGTVWVPGKKPETEDLEKLKKFFQDWNQ